MKTRSYFKEAGHTAVDRDPTASGFGNTAEDLEKRGFTRAVATNDPDTIASSDLEADVFECPELFDFIALDDGPAGQHVAGLAREVLGVVRDHVAQCGVPF